jgi:hypothetical protein
MLQLLLVAHAGAVGTTEMALAYSRISVLNAVMEMLGPNAVGAEWVLNAVTVRLTSIYMLAHLPFFHLLSDLSVKSKSFVAFYYFRKVLDVSQPVIQVYQLLAISLFNLTLIDYLAYEGQSKYCV